jgi:hypothetical protein
MRNALLRHRNSFRLKFKPTAALRFAFSLRKRPQFVCLLATFRAADNPAQDSKAAK